MANAPSADKLVEYLTGAIDDMMVTAVDRLICQGVDLQRMELWFNNRRRGIREDGEVACIIWVDWPEAENADGEWIAYVRLAFEGKWGHDGATELRIDPKPREPS